MGLSDIAVVALLVVTTRGPARSRAFAFVEANALAGGFERNSPAFTRFQR